MRPLGRAVRPPGRVHPTYGSGRRPLEGTRYIHFRVLSGRKEVPLVEILLGLQIHNNGSILFYGARALNLTDGKLNEGEDPPVLACSEEAQPTSTNSTSAEIAASQAAKATLENDD